MPVALRAQQLSLPNEQQESSPVPLLAQDTLALLRAAAPLSFALLPPISNSEVCIKTLLQWLYSQKCYIARKRSNTGMHII